jgi:hypothetical protein
LEKTRHDPVVTAEIAHRGTHMMLGALPSLRAIQA